MKNSKKTKSLLNITMIYDIYLFIQSKSITTMATRTKTFQNFLILSDSILGNSDYNDS